MNDKKKTLPFTMVSQKVWELNLTAIQGHILHRIMFWVGKSKTQECFESRASISQACNLSEPIVSKTIAELERLNIIEIERGKSKGKSNRLTMKQESLWQVRPQVENQTPKKQGGRKEVSTLGSKEVSTLRGEGVVRRFLPGSKEVSTGGGNEVTTKENSISNNRISDCIKIAFKEIDKEIELNEINSPTGSSSSPDGSDGLGEESALEWFARIAEMPIEQKIEMTDFAATQITPESPTPAATPEPSLTKKESKSTNRRKRVKEAHQTILDAEVIDDNQSGSNDSGRARLTAKQPIPETQSVALVPIDALPAKPSRERKSKPEGPTPGSLIFEAFADAYDQRYGFEPPRGKEANRWAKKIFEEVGLEDGRNLVRHYVSMNKQWFLQKGHSLEWCFRDLTEVKRSFVTGRTMTSSQIKEIEQRQTVKETHDEVQQSDGRLAAAWARIDTKRTIKI